MIILQQLRVIKEGNDRHPNTSKFPNQMPKIQYVMSQTNNFQLQFFIKLTEIIGRTFTDLQALLASELKRQQSQSIAMPDHHGMRDEGVEAPRGGQADGRAVIESNLYSGEGNIQRNRLLMDNKLGIKINEDQEMSVANRNLQPQPRKKKRIKRKTKIIKKRIDMVEKSRLKTKKIRKRRKILPKTFTEKGPTLKRTRKGKQKKPTGPRKPHPPLNAFMLFLQQNKKQIMKKKPELSPSQVSVYASTIWNEYGEAEKQAYLKVYRKNHEEYLEELKAFREREGTRRAKMAEERRNNAQKEKEKQKENDKDSPFSFNDSKLKEPVIQLRENLRSRSQKRKQGGSEVICLDSEAERQQSLANDKPECGSNE